MMKSALISGGLLVLFGCAAPQYDSVYQSQCSFSLDGDEALTFKIKNDTAYLSGVVCDGSLDAFENMISQHPHIQMLVFESIDGSADDETNIDLAYRIREYGLDSYIAKTGHIASGGTDLFLAGVNRTVEPGAKIGVHSWSAGVDLEGKDLPRDHQEHNRYLDYYTDIGVNRDFYWFTLEAASANDMHYMSMEELRKYGFMK
ncbi:alpha/beta hydrolase [Vibrio scophthalmi]|uniref:Beta-lactamase n=1 Tax=Vibrio scophthalmi TaxID=45658 RepID=A0A1C7FHM8_9VIBR|nr:alpha/beta hydrolase [Vibrio scophthalmi]ANU38509.1 Beta-lactamase [Vibrio scophthalmi]